VGGGLLVFPCRLEEKGASSRQLRLLHPCIRILHGCHRAQPSVPGTTDFLASCASTGAVVMAKANRAKVGCFMAPSNDSYRKTGWLCSPFIIRLHNLSVVQ